MTNRNEVSEMAKANYHHGTQVWHDHSLILSGTKGQHYICPYADALLVADDESQKDMVTSAIIANDFLWRMCSGILDQQLHGEFYRPEDDEE